MANVKFTYVFAAINRSDTKNHPVMLRTIARNEKEARKIFVAPFVLSLAARLPVSEVCHG